MEYGTAASRYERYAADREGYLERARDVAKLTMPHLLVDDSHSSSSKLPTPYQSVGAQAVASLSSKLLMALYPPNTPFFKLTVDPYKLDQVTGDPAIRTEVEGTLNKIEQAVMSEIEAQGYRPALHEAIKQLVIAGNALIYMPKGGGMQVFKLDRYVVKRDPMGALQHLLIKEQIAPASLPEELKEAVPETRSLEETVDVYTCIHRMDDKKFSVHQEVLGQVVESTRGEYSEDTLPYLALRLEEVSGESYAYGYATLYLGDLKSLEGLSQALVEASAMASKCLWLVDPGSPTRARTLADSPNGAIREGREQDVSMVTMGSKAADMRITFEVASQIRERIGLAFLMNTQLQRKGERVTATEWRILAEELESVLSGSYASLSASFQLPLVSLIIARMTKERRLPKLPKDIVHPSIVTGLEALGRGADLMRLDSFIAGALQQVGPEMLNQYMNIGDYLSRRATALGLVTDGLIKSEEQIAQERQQAMQARMLQQFGPDVMRMSVDQASQQQAQQEQ
jgi:hypothetical protein